jgi:hypothetical protein
VKEINFGRVFLGGIVAGVLINISEFLLNDVVLKADMEARMTALGRTVPRTPGTVVVWVVLGFAIGIASVWLYAAIRPRYGAGAATAARAGVFVWFFGSVVTTVVIVNMGLFPFSPLALAWELAQAIVTTIVGASLYRENAAAA